MNTHALLQKFVARPAEERFYFTKPYRKDGFLYATDGGILVRVTDDPEVTDVDDSGRYPDCEKLLQRHDFDPGPFVPLAFERPAEPPACKPCKGSGQVAVCPSCDGRGEFEHYGDDYDCQHCSGSGHVAGRGKTCVDCNGSGNDTAIAIDVGTQTFQLRYLLVLETLPGIRIANNADAGEAGRFIFDGGIGLLMPFRK